MAYTFGGAATDHIPHTAIVDAGAASYSWLMCGWFKPTTLTAGRVLFSYNAIGGYICIGATTANLEIRLDRATTDRNMTHGVGLVTNVWQWICVFNTVSGAGASSSVIWRVAANATSHPISTSAIGGSSLSAGSGAAVGGLNRCVGNLAAGQSLAFQGDIGQILFMSSQNNSLLTSGFPIQTPGTIASAEGEALYAGIVLPLYKGYIPEEILRTAQSGALELTLYDLGQKPAMAQSIVNHKPSPFTITPTLELVPSGPVWTDERPPFEYDFLPASRLVRR